GVAGYAENLASYLEGAIADPERFVRALGKEGRPLLTRLLDAVKEVLAKFGIQFETSQKRELKVLKLELAKTPLERAVAPEVAVRAALAIKSALDRGISLATPESEQSTRPASVESATLLDALTAQALGNEPVRPEGGDDRNVTHSHRGADLSVARSVAPQTERV